MKKVALLLFPAILSGCGNDLNVRSEWGAGMANYGLTAFYPPRENVFTGDVILVTYNPCGQATSKLMQTDWLGTIDMSAAFAEVYKTRPELPATSATTRQVGAGAGGAPSGAGAQGQIVNGPAQGSGAVTVTVTVPSTQANPSQAAITPPQASPTNVSPQPVSSSTTPIFPTNGQFRPRLAAFPDYSISSSTQFVASGGGVFSGIFAGLGLGSRQSTHLSVSVSGVEEVALPLPVAIRLILPQIANRENLNGLFNPVAIGRIIADRENAMIDEAKCSSPQSYKASIVVINRVFYARSFTFDFGNNSAIAALASAAVAGAAAKPAQVAPNSGPAAADPNQVAATALLAQLTGSLGSSTPSGSLSIETTSSGSVGLKQTFDRPLAFGVDHSIGFSVDEVMRSLALPSTATGTGQSTERAELFSSQYGRVRLASLDGMLLAQGQTAPNPAPAGQSPTQATPRECSLTDTECARERLSTSQGSLPQFCKSLPCGVILRPRE